MEEKNKKWLLAALGLAAVTVGVIYFRKKKRAKSASKNITSKEAEGVPSAIEIEDGSVGFGSEGEDVKYVQQYINTTCPSELKQLGLFPLNISGKWDKETDKAAIACSALKRNVIDEVTLKRIKRDLSNSKSE